MWALVAAAFTPEINGVITMGTLASYQPLVEQPYHEVRGYFWVPEAPRDVDLMELSALVSPRPVAWLGGGGSDGAADGGEGAGALYGVDGRDV